MFHRKTDASKIALVALVQYLRAHRFLFLDTQWTTPHLLKFGTYEVPARGIPEASEEGAGGTINYILLSGVNGHEIDSQL